MKYYREKNYLNEIFLLIPGIGDESNFSLSEAQSGLGTE
jgi:hypothetical protein